MIDVAEGRRLLAATQVASLTPFDALSEWTTWINDNLPALLDAAEELAEWHRLCDEQGVPYDPEGYARHTRGNAMLVRAVDDLAEIERNARERDAARAELTALREGIKALADRVDREGHLWSGAPAHTLFKIAEDARALLDRSKP